MGAGASFLKARAAFANADLWVNMSDVVSSDEVMLPLRDDPSATSTIRLTVANRGKRRGDMLWAQGGLYVPVSDRLVDVLDRLGATGWRTVPAHVEFKDGEELPGYQVLVVTGSCGNFLEGALDEGGDRIPGAVIDPAKGWDGSDIFWIDARPHFTFLTTNRVRQALDSAGITGVVYTDAI